MLVFRMLGSLGVTQGPGVTHRTLVIEAIEIIIESDRPLKRDLGESLSWQPTILHPWTM